MALALGWYNWARFGNPLEFGHNFLPEFTRDPEQPQMGFKYVAGNLRNLFRLPTFVNGRLEFERFNGFAFWLANPIYVTAGIAMVVKAVRRRWDLLDALLLAGFAVELFLTLMHKTLGGWQFGARYLADLVPMLLLIELRGRDRVTAWERAIGLFAIAFTWCFHVCFTIRSLMQPQPDVQEYGRLFSYVLIWTFNVAGVIAWIACTTEVTWRAVGECLWARISGAYLAIGLRLFSA